MMDYFILELQLRDRLRLSDVLSQWHSGILSLRECRNSPGKAIRLQLLANSLRWNDFLHHSKRSRELRSWQPHA